MVCLEICTRIVLMLPPFQSMRAKTTFQCMRKCDIQRKSAESPSHAPGISCSLPHVCALLISLDFVNASSALIRNPRLSKPCLHFLFQLFYLVVKLFSELLAHLLRRISPITEEPTDCEHSPLIARAPIAACCRWYQRSTHTGLLDVHLGDRPHLSLS